MQLLNAYVKNLPKLKILLLNRKLCASSWHKRWLPSHKSRLKEHAFHDFEQILSTPYFHKFGRKTISLDFSNSFLLNWDNIVVIFMTDEFPWFKKAKIFFNNHSQEYENVVHRKIQTQGLSALLLRICKSKQWGAPFTSD